MHIYIQIWYSEFLLRIGTHGGYIFMHEFTPYTCCCHLYTFSLMLLRGKKKKACSFVGTGWFGKEGHYGYGPNLANIT